MKDADSLALTLLVSDTVLHVDAEKLGLGVDKLDSLALREAAPVSEAPLLGDELTLKDSVSVEDTLCEALTLFDTLLL